MAAPRYDYLALKDIPVGGVVGYRAGDGVMADAVDNLGLQSGVDVVPARPDVVARPSGNGRRDEWYGYALGQGKTPEDLEDLGRDQIRDLFPADEAPAAAPEAAPAEDTTADTAADTGDEQPARAGRKRT